MSKKELIIKTKPSENTITELSDKAKETRKMAVQYLYAELILKKGQGA